MEPELSIIVPVFNEAKTVAEVMQALNTACAEAQIIYVDDGSSDDSLNILKKHAREQDIILTKENGGKGSAVRLGLTKATGAFTIFHDADLEYDPQQIQILLHEAKQHTGAVIFGSRFKQDNPNLYKTYLLGNKVLTHLINILFGGRLTDSYTCYKLFPTNVLKSIPLRAQGFELEAELCCQTLKRKIPIQEVPISYNPRSLEEGKKIRFHDAIRGLLTMLRVRLNV